ncbi:MAG: hypothetical protein NUV77_27040, partial [Thermoguttaceae bacterium]|nr:hypothetical protein [Thermoguttaceae bacterium]
RYRERYSAGEQRPREGQRRTSPAGSEQVFHEHRWHNVPESESRGSDSGERRNRYHAAATAKFAQALKDAGIPNSESWETAARSVFDRMSLDALIHFTKNIREYRFFPTFEALRKHLSARYPRASEKAEGGYDSAKGILFLNGGKTVHEIARRYAHEFAHAVDGKFSLSGSPDWQSAWKKELDTHAAQTLLGARVRRDAHEGFAEFGVAVWTMYSAEIVQKLFPRCWAVWQKLGLV